MILRAALIGFCLLVLAGVAVVFEAAQQTANALSALSIARTSNSPPVRSAILRQAIASLDESWARPTLWHAGALEALSALDTQLGQDEGGDRALYANATAAAKAELKLAPISPRADLRLAYFADLGVGNVGCTVAECLARSWRTGPVLDRDADCARLELAGKAHVVTSARDPRVAGFVRAGATREDIAKCLAFLPAGEVFHLLLTTK